MFFRHIDFAKTAARQVQPPFKPRVADKLDVSNFDKQFTRQEVDQIASADESFMLDIDQSLFDGFSFASASFCEQLGVDKRTAELPSCPEQPSGAGAASSELTENEGNDRTQTQAYSSKSSELKKDK